VLQFMLDGYPEYPGRKMEPALMVGAKLTDISPEMVEQVCGAIRDEDQAQAAAAS